MPEWLLIGARSILFAGVLFAITKLIGKKQISELSFFEYVSGITIGSIAGEIIMGLDNHWASGILSILIFGLVTLFADILSLKSKSFRDFFEGKGTIFIKDGKILEDNLKKERYSIDDLSSLLRQKNVFKTADVEFAVLEPRGDLSIMLKKENQPLTPKDLQLNLPQEKEPQTVIMDGKILNDPLAESGKSRKWLDMEIEKLGLTIDNIFLGQIDSYGELTVDIFDDSLKVPAPQQRPLLMAMIKKCAADLEVFSLQTDSKKAQEMYEKNTQKLNQIIQKLSPYLK
ncbi:DUF421 domain-containing protein [Cytobacillus pseudoceanisediminis]|jgi:uncharacterized membrane protein YcaP (DUF421 family)|uniref:DUF421 domain-containing protein n=1 Tax=Cytobacillus pseudoceanisediminis TaxID=3051614 RepID=A0ABZ2ZR47_9BACI|nr:MULTISPECIES: DUF421 domain-containing protein [Cytobacillus]MBY0156053.1 DUF421 domain-containing protein [Cytobacillus firmus]MBU8771863.1 DUF421 domain-containing protein [Cytobacillus oceanisediminis]MCM3245750.1 DUF421 domain-containing protein [Cytobacillus oceanisediminis]MCM3395134.1 DUF421 domain-containing protein [Cytobacillus oceanisediminis]MCM3527488.1 DUF421 domain-containing protein [Cytobacillus oceanisediminis]